MKYTEHYSVMKKEVLQSLNESSSKRKLFADLTFGGGGHTCAIAEYFPSSNVYSTDQDPEAFKNGLKLLEERNLNDRVTLLKTNFEQFPTLIKEAHPEVIENGGFDGILLDIGVSNHHFESGDRGFSFRFDAPLDMRMAVDNDEIKTAKDLINELSERELEELLRTYGEEKFAKRIAENIVAKRSEKKIETTKELEDIIFHSYPKNMRFGKIHPATKSFQALRIAVNRELEVISEVIPMLIPLLSIGGRLLIITFHSLEDRIVKQAFKEASKQEPYVQILTKKPIIPSKKEIHENSKSRSAKLRVLERVKEIPSKNKYKEFSTIRED